MAHDPLDLERFANASSRDPKGVYRTLDQVAEFVQDLGQFQPDEGMRWLIAQWSAGFQRGGLLAMRRAAGPLIRQLLDVVDDC